MPTRLARAIVGLAIMAIAVTLVVGAAPSSPASPICTHVVALGGSDENSGTSSSPFATVEKLAAEVGPGETGCLRAGIHRTDALTLRSAGKPEARITLRNYPGEEATLLGPVVLTKEADYVTIAGLTLDGRNPARRPSPIVSSTGAVFRHNDVTNRNTSICFVLGSTRVGGLAHFGLAYRPLLERNRIHHCGSLPATNHHHGVYVEGSRGAIIRGNWIYANADRGVQFYPDADRSRVYGNVIVGNGQGVSFGGEEGLASDGNLVEHNVLSHSRIRADVESYFPPGQRTGGGNVVRNNCLQRIQSAPNGSIDRTAGGFSSRANQAFADVGYRNRIARDYRLRRSSPCHRTMGRYAGAGAGTPAQVTALVVRHRR